MRIEQHDLRRLLQEPSARVRKDIGEKICAGYVELEFQGNERNIAEDIIRLLIKDTSMRVRRMVADYLKASSDVPRDIIQKLASDHSTIAESILAETPLLSEYELQEIARSTKSLRKLMAIAGRSNVSAPLSSTLIERGELAVTKKVIQNTSAHIDEDTFAYILEEYYQEDSILEALVYRSGLPYKVADKLFVHVANHLKKILIHEYNLPYSMIDEATQHAYESSLVKLMSPTMGQQDIRKLIDRLHDEKRLTDGMLIRSLCVGDLRFFQTAIAKRAGVSLSSARLLLLDPSGYGFKRIYRMAEMPDNYLEPLRCVYHCAQEESKLGMYYHHAFTLRVIERIISENYHRNVENMPVILTLLNREAGNYGTWQQ